MRPSDKAWCVLAAWVIGWNIAAKDSEQLSEACDRYLEKRPWLTRAVAVAITVHLLNAVPNRFDVVHGIFLAARSVRRRVS